MLLLIFLYTGLPLFLIWILYRAFYRKENFQQMKEAIFTGLFCFAFIGVTIYLLS